MRRFLIDTDTASDDAVALVMAAKAPDVQIEAVTIVAGNVPLAQAVQNALYTLELAGCSAPVYAGLDKPLLRPLDTAQMVHGQDGMGDLGLPLRDRIPATGHAADVLIETIRRWPGEITLVTLGPLSNIAAALVRDPSIARLVQRCVMMGGTSDSVGNVTPVSEYNIWADPEAAKIVFESGLPIEMIGWDISRKYATFNHEESAALRAIGTPLAEFCVDIQSAVDAFATSTTQLAGYDLPDPIAMAAALDPATVEFEHWHVEIETLGTLCRGQTVNDPLGLLGLPPNVKVAVRANRARFLELLYAAARG
ncbi:MAG TPA: nucleoside hydrolase [Candidatus Limnocylindrales bacterium]|nr:nucleoside hydrolase [Candidatus Limnocylindrales bacterium]